MHQMTCGAVGQLLTTDHCLQFAIPRISVTRAIHITADHPLTTVCHPARFHPSKGSTSQLTMEL